MKIKACCLGCSAKLVGALSGREFAVNVLGKVVGTDLGVADVLNRPAEYYVQNADEGPSPLPGMMGIEVRLTGVSRAGRTPKQFHTAKKTLEKVVAETVLPNLEPGEECQVYCVIMIDGEIETVPNSGAYLNCLEGPAFWVKSPTVSSD